MCFIFLSWFAEFPQVFVLVFLVRYKLARDRVGVGAVLGALFVVLHHVRTPAAQKWLVESLGECRLRSGVVVVGDLRRYMRDPCLAALDHGHYWIAFVGPQLHMSLWVLSLFSRLFPLPSKSFVLSLVHHHCHHDGRILRIERTCGAGITRF